MKKLSPNKVRIPIAISIVTSIAIVIVISTTLLSCTSKKKKVTPAFYHWQTNFSLTAAEKQYLYNFSVKKLYVKFFDVDWNASANEPLPVVTVIFDSTQWKTVEIIPTIFITNRSLKNYPLEKMEMLGENILTKIFSIKNEVKEIQIDCDWSETTEQKYFRLLRFIKKEIEQKGMQLSATIRLHQVKYFKRTGVPPVDRGMLMFYNVDDVKDPDTRNSILDLEVVKQYFYNFEDYPLALDVALPVFSWGVLFRGGQMIKLLAPLQLEDLRDDEFFQQKDATHFEVKKSTYLNGRYLYAADEIRLETISLPTLISAAEQLTPRIQNADITLSFYHLDTTTIKTYPYEQLQAIIQTIEN
ncbi:MAG: hypothetical protein AAF573_13690 [Bacteroidota bacterium]